jgi:alkylglycerol monooxygenase
VDLVPFAIPFFLLAIILEVVWDIHQKTGYYRINDAINSLSMGVLSTASKLVLIDVAGRIYSWVQQDMAIVQWPFNGWLSLVVAFVVYDFFYYWFHRISHERKIFWASHIAHHQSEEYNLTTALRQTSTGFIISWVFYIPCFLLGMPAEIFVTVASANLIYQFWVHTRFVTTIGPLEKVLVTPKNHRVHHARNPEYIDKNYGGFFILWDRMFGTYKPEDKNLPVDFGITRGLNSWNPLWANLHVYVGMFRDSWITPRWSDKLNVWLGATGFAAPGISKQAVTPGNHYDPDTTLALKCYVTVQFLLTLVAATSLTYFANELGASVMQFVFSFVLISLLILGRLLDGRGLGWEYLRLLSAMLLLLVLPLPALLQQAILITVLASAVLFICLRRAGSLR